jgi:site-specific DNA recombinase
VPALDIEQAIVAALEAEDAGRASAEPPPGSTFRGLEHCEKIVIRKHAIDISLAEDGSQPVRVITVPWGPTRHYRRREIVIPAGPCRHAIIRPIRAEARARLLEAIAKARLWVDEIVSGKVTGTDVIARREALSERSIRMTLNLAFLAPDVVKAAENGTLPHGLGLSDMTDLPMKWSDQREILGYFQGPSEEGQWS